MQIGRHNILGGRLGVADGTGITHIVVGVVDVEVSELVDN